MRFTSAALYIILAFAAALFLLWLISLAHAHGWYDRSCCADRDCHPVPCEEIRQAPGGYVWQRGPNDEVTFMRDRMKVSQDESCHVCIADGVSPAGICIYLPART
jgi:hypothetical protein